VGVQETAGRGHRQLGGYHRRVQNQSNQLATVISFQHKGEQPRRDC